MAMIAVAIAIFRRLADEGVVSLKLSLLL